MASFLEMSSPAHRGVNHIPAVVVVETLAPVQDDGLGLAGVDEVVP